MDSLVMLLGVAMMMLVVITTAAGIARYSKFYRRELAESGNRELALDGLRGMAALMVATHHAILSIHWLVNGNWGGAQTQLLGPGGVMIFFLLTGCLFWGKARAANGKVNALKLWRGRLYRIVPLYLFSVLVVLLVAASQTGGHWLALENWRPLLRVLALGALNWHAIGTLNLGDYNAGVVWTLWYEWFFYLLLPFIAWLAVGRRIYAGAVFLYVLLIGCLWLNCDQHFAEFSSFFLLGMLCPVLLSDPELRAKLRQPRAAVLAMSLALVLGLLPHSRLFAHMPYSSVAGALFPLFFVVAAGNSFFGFLTHPAIRCLGAISFSLYLLHGIMFRLVYHWLLTAGATHLPQLDYWFINLGIAILTTLLCALTYRWIEFPFISSSHKKTIQTKRP
jgi:peptidoglycan/LPS O-acetylase OafA/YrhL